LGIIPPAQLKKDAASAERPAKTLILAGRWLHTLLNASMQARHLHGTHAPGAEIIVRHPYRRLDQIAQAA